MVVLLRGEYEAMDCVWDSTYLNEYNQPADARMSNRFFNGQISIHDNDREDRRFRWRYCKPFPSEAHPYPYQWCCTTTLRTTMFNHEFRRGCGGTGLITQINSIHDNNVEDRRFAIECNPLIQAYSLTDCAWGDYVNSYNAKLDYTCADNGVMRGIESIHGNDEQDRKFKFECCRIQSNPVKAYPAMSCVEDDLYLNVWDGVHNDNNKAGYFLSGQMSKHDNDKQDRRFKWRYCKANEGFGTALGTSDLPQTKHKEEWERSCDHINGGDAAIVGGYSQHDNNVEDRKWTWKCGELNTDYYRLVSCGYTGDLNNFNGIIDFDCPQEGVIRSIWSRYSNTNDDRLWRFECCNVADVDFTFNNIEGTWIDYGCTGCSKTEFSVTKGITTTQTHTVTSEFTMSLEVSIKAGYTWGAGSASMTITGGISQTTSETVSYTQQTSSFTTVTRTCEKDHLYQWQNTANIQKNGVDFGSMTALDENGGNLYCTSNDRMECPLGACADPDCTICTDAYYDVYGSMVQPLNEPFSDPFNDDEQYYNDDSYRISRYLSDGGIVGVVLVMVNIALIACIARHKASKERRYHIVSNDISDV